MGIRVVLSCYELVKKIPTMQELAITAVYLKQNFEKNSG
jgi:hypothetical protein